VAFVQSGQYAVLTGPTGCGKSTLLETICGLKRLSAGEILIDGLKLLDLNNLRTRTPHGLSGGEKQRVAIGRALAFRPKLLCLDEPLSAIDASMRNRMVNLLKSIHAAEETSILHVTHYPNELSDIDSIQFQMENGTA